MITVRNACLNNIEWLTELILQNCLSVVVSLNGRLKRKMDMKKRICHGSGAQNMAEFASAENGEWSILTLGSLCLPCCVWDKA